MSSKLGSTDNEQLDELMEGVPHYRGCYPKDFCNGKTPWPEEYLILNLENSGHGGSHWTAVCNKPDSPYIEYFDSFGLPIPQTILNYMRRSKKRVVGSNNEIQSLKSDACGYYAVNYLKQRAAGRSIYDILYQFHKAGALANDKILIKDLQQQKNNNKLVVPKTMTKVKIFNHQGTPVSSANVKGSKTLIKKVLRNLPKGKRTVHVQVGGDMEEPVTVSYDPEEVHALKSDEQIGGNPLLSALITALPTLLPVVTPLLKKGVDWLVGNGMGGDSDETGGGYDDDDYQDGGAVDYKAINRDIYHQIDNLGPLTQKFGGSKAARERFAAIKGSQLFNDPLTKELKKVRKDYYEAHQKMGKASNLYYDPNNVEDKRAFGHLLLQKRLDEALQQKIAKSKAKDKSNIQLTEFQTDKIRKEVKSLMRQTEPVEGREIIIKKDKKGERLAHPRMEIFEGRPENKQVTQAIYNELKGGPRAKKPLTEYQKFVKKYFADFYREFDIQEKLPLKDRMDIMRQAAKEWRELKGENQMQT
jgi:hypothetical protein